MARGRRAPAAGSISPGALLTLLLASGGMGEEIEAYEDYGNSDLVCRVCGCIDSDCSECWERTGEPCYWVEEDLCSACATKENDS